jgi:regulatory protein
MPEITGIETQKHDPERVNIYLDGTFGFGASAAAAHAHGLATGRRLTEEEVDSLRSGDAEDRAYSSALNYLSSRPRSRREMEQYFRRKATDPEIAAAAIGRLERSGLVNDLEFGRFWVENRLSFKPRGRRALQVELLQKGLSRDDIEGALADLGDEEGLAYDAGAKRVRSFSRLNEQEFFKRMVGFLQRRGFSYSVSAAASKRLAEERCAPEE